MTTPQNQDPSWYSDIAATHHLTPDINNLTIHYDEYVGTDQICVGNGVGLPIHHVGSSKFHSSTKSLFLNQLLHVPSIEKDLLSIW